MAGAATLPKKPKKEVEHRSPAPPPRSPVASPRSNDPKRSSVLAVGSTSSAVVDISASTFAPSQAITDEIAATRGKGLDVRVIARGLTSEGLVKVRQMQNKKFVSLNRGSMPLLNPWTQKLGGMYLNFSVADSAIKNGLASFKERGGDKNDWLQAIKKDSTALGGLGLKVQSLPNPVNKFEAGKLTLGVKDMKIVVGGYVDAGLELLLENMSAPKIVAVAEIKIKGAESQKLQLESDGNKLTGSVSLAIQLASFNGAVKASYLADGNVDISGKAAYSANKLSGEILFVSTDEATAMKFAKDAIAAAGGKENIQEAAAPAPVPVAKEGSKKRALAATGQLAFNLTNWFAGTVNVVVDGKGMVTVIGKIAPPGEITLFKQRDWDKEIVKLEAKAYYGIPVVGNLNLFANISLHAIAKLGPAKLYNIEILGTYSTDPEIQKSIQISGSINISAYGGLRLRAEGGAGITLLKHDLKFGIGLNADVGVKAYADARPTIGYRDPGIFYVSGTLDLVAQPILGLSGEFFIELDAPWFSPIDDDRWSWPLFSKEWPLGDPIGISASVKDYVLGSGAVPEITMKPPEFDPSKFMTNMVDDNLPNKSGGPGGSRGSFKEDGSVQKPVVPPKKPPPKAASTKPVKKGPSPKGGKSGKPAANAASEQANAKLLESAANKLAALKGRPPMLRDLLDKELAVIKKQSSGINFDVKEKGTKWQVSPRGSGKPVKGKTKVPMVELSRDAKSKVEWWRMRKPFKDGAKAGHNLYFAGEGRKAHLMMASEPLSFEQVLKDKKNGIPDDHRAALTQKLAALNAKIAKRADKLGEQEAQDAFQREIESDVNTIAVELGQYMNNADNLPVTAVTWGANAGRAASVRAEPLTKIPGNTTGSSATGDREHAVGFGLISRYDKPTSHQRSGIAVDVDKSRVTAAHLLHHELHGPYKLPWNIALADQALNNRMSTIEGPIVKLVKSGKRLRYGVTVSYYNNNPPPANAMTDTSPTLADVRKWVDFYIAKSATITAHEWDGSAYKMSVGGGTAEGEQTPIKGEPTVPVEKQVLDELQARLVPTNIQADGGTNYTATTVTSIDTFARDVMGTKAPIIRKAFDTLLDSGQVRKFSARGPFFVRN